MSETVALDFEFKSPIERVWQALTDTTLMSKWMFFDAEDVQPVVGHHFRLKGKPAIGWPMTIDCEVLEAERPTRLAYTWVVQGMPHSTTVTWTLAQAEDGVTRLHLEQSGFASGATQEIGGAKYGWQKMLEQLRDHLAAA